MAIDQLAYEELPIDQLPTDPLALDQVPIDISQIDQWPIDQMPIGQLARIGTQMVRKGPFAYHLRTFCVPFGYAKGTQMERKWYAELIHSRKCNENGTQTGEYAAFL